jgi:hypothetical protein
MFSINPFRELREYRRAEGPGDLPQMAKAYLSDPSRGKAIAADRHAASGPNRAGSEFIGTWSFAV